MRLITKDRFCEQSGVKASTLRGWNRNACGHAESELNMPMMPGGLNMMVKTEETYGTQPADGAGVRILEVTAPAITGTPEYAMTIGHACQHCDAMTVVTLRGKAGTPIGEAISALAAAMAGE